MPGRFIGGGEMNGKEVFDMIPEKPYQAVYLAIHGMKSAISEWDIPKIYKNSEDLYKACLKEGITWEKLINFDGYNESELT